MLERAIKRHVAAQVGEVAAPSGGDDDRVGRLDPETVLEAFLVSDQAFLDSVVPTLLDSGVSLSAFYKTIVRPVAAKLGDLWCEDEVDFVRVEIVSTRLRLMCNQLVTRRMAGRTPWHEDGRRRILLANTGGDQHTLGFSMAEAFFQDAGWNVDGGADLRPGPDYYDTLQAGDFPFVAIAFARDDACDPTDMVARTRQASARRDVRICLGGVAVSASPDRYRAAGADIVALDALDAVRQAEGLLAVSPWEKAGHAAPAPADNGAGAGRADKGS
ncbi:B12-binding domain-containing protein [Oceaniradius stylonematis]|uniref:cobalamin B12-binding domain-containing protein n=1 Tax=Oceaniradius stylonematis TaxID=2184161 RepID=UPI00273FD9E0|nr:cobalamin-dependent protein [Oceaniradius stylonematis]